MKYLLNRIGGKSAGASDQVPKTVANVGQWNNGDPSDGLWDIL